MNMTHLQHYVELEALMLEMERIGDHVSAEKIRTQMDTAWYALSETEHAMLSARSVPEGVTDAESGAGNKRRNG